MNRQKGFIQMPILIAVIVGVLVVGGTVSYVGVQWYQNYQTEKIQQQEIATENEQATKTDELSEVEKLRQEVEELKKESEATKGKQEALEQKVTSEQQKPKPQDFSISTLEIGSYLGGVTQVSCPNSEGSGFLMNLDIGYVTVTNDHVISGNSQCAVLPEDRDGETLGHFQLNIASPYEWNPYTDIAILKMSVSPAAQSWSKPITSLNYNLSNLRSCPLKMPEGSPVIVIGYPAFGKQQVQVQEYNSQISSKQVTEGIISGHDTSVEYPVGSLPYSNYYVSAKIDSGNSGGIALSKDSSGLCLLGVATWLSLGNFETQGVVQNIHNVFYVG